MIAKTLLMCSLLGWTLGAEDLRNTMMDRQSLHQYSLAKCSDGSAAAYFIDKVSILHHIWFMLIDVTADRQFMVTVVVLKTLFNHINGT